MTPPPSPAPSGLRRVLLLGAGHAHLEVIRQAAAFRAAGASLTVVAPPEFWYSGLATSALAGRVPEVLDRLDVAAFCRAMGVEWVEGEAAAADPGERTVTLRNGSRLGYDLLSVNVGSVVPAGLPGLAAHAVPARPLEPLLALGRHLGTVAGSREGTGGPGVVVLGAGPTGCEVALALRARSGSSLPVTVVAPGEPLPGFGPRARRLLRRALDGAGVEFHAGEAEAVEEGELRLSGGGALPFRRLVNATGLVPNPVARSLGLPVDEDGALLVGRTLEAPSRAGHFAVGDCARVEGAGHPRAGVYSVRQAPVLVNNLLAHLTGKPPRAFRLRRPVLLILSLADGTGLATFGPLAARGRWALRWKDRLDLEWLARYRVDP